MSWKQQAEPSVCMHQTLERESPCVMPAKYYCMACGALIVRYAHIKR
jgi:hypothetical protein